MQLTRVYSNCEHSPMKTGTLLSNFKAVVNSVRSFSSPFKHFNKWNMTELNHYLLTRRNSHLKKSVFVVVQEDSLSFAHTLKNILQRSSKC